MFQFLIGRLITKIRAVEPETCRWFQFLIGRLITGISIIFPVSLISFQFLIGRLITVLKLAISDFLTHVSIPHR